MKTTKLAETGQVPGFGRSFPEVCGLSGRGCPSALFTFVPIGHSRALPVAEAFLCVISHVTFPTPKQPPFITYTVFYP